MHGSGRLLLGATGLADAAPRPRLRALAARAEAVVAAPLPLERRHGEAGRLPGLGLQQALPRALRPAHLPRGRGPRLRDDALRQPDRQLRPAGLRRHAQRELRAWLAARELLRRERTA